MIVPLDENDESPGTYCQNFLSSGTYSDKRPGTAMSFTDLVVVTGSGESITLSNFAALHKEGVFCLVPSSPGFESIEVEGAVFQRKSPSGHLWINISDLCLKMLLEGRQKNGSQWIHNNRKRWLKHTTWVGGGYDLGIWVRKHPVGRAACATRGGSKHVPLVAGGGRASART